MMFFDAHIHNKNHEAGGLIIGLEGRPVFERTLNNSEVLKMHNPKENYIAFYYIQDKEKKTKIDHLYLKYHPRREKYIPYEVIESIKINQPKCVMIDTLNEPFWVPYDYWQVARTFPSLTFILAHAGGYLINDFIKICHFQKNVWIDFALTHSVLGRLGDERCGLPYINQAIKYALNSPFKNRILMSSDYPFFDQEDVFNYYTRLGVIDLMNDNFIALKEIIL